MAFDVVATKGLLLMLRMSEYLIEMESKVEQYQQRAS